MLRIGHGYDVHRLVEGRRLILGGVGGARPWACWATRRRCAHPRGDGRPCWGRPGWETSGGIPGHRPGLRRGGQPGLLDYVVELLEAQGWKKLATWMLPYGAAA